MIDGVVGVVGRGSKSGILGYSEVGDRSRGAGGAKEGYHFDSREVALEVFK